MNKLLIATNNQGKIVELQQLLSDLNIELITPADINLALDVIEDGHTYAENATKKAVAFAQASGLISLADDSGLEVDALNGDPGIYSARYGSSYFHSLAPNPQDLGRAGGGLLSFADRRKFLVGNLKDKPRPWTAHFRATIAIAIPENDTLNDSEESVPSQARLFGRNEHSLRVTLTEGTCEGEIIPEDRGDGGFGYDPIFLLPELEKTMAELSMEEKNRLSHRAKAVMNAKGILNKLFSK
jgi:XTP/dITP diphosphohydrolase